MKEKQSGWFGALKGYLGKSIVESRIRDATLRWEGTLLELNGCLERVRNQVSGEVATQFEESQRTWEIYRDAAVELDLHLVDEGISEPSATRLVSLCGLAESRISDLEWKEPSGEVTQLHAAEEELAEVLGKIRPFLNDKNRPLFEMLQSTWAQYRDAQAIFQAGMTGEESAHMSALLELTRNQVSALNGTLSILDP